MATIDKPDETAAAAVPNFYSGQAGERREDQITAAAKLEGLEHEIAVLRVKFKEILSAEPVDYAIVLRMAEVLTRAVAAQYRLSPRAGKNMAAHFTALLNDLGDQILPADR